MRQVNSCPVANPGCDSAFCEVSNIVTHFPPLLCVALVRMPADGSRKLRDEGVMPPEELDLRKMVNTQLCEPKGALLPGKLMKCE